MEIVLEMVWPEGHDVAFVRWLVIDGELVVEVDGERTVVTGVPEATDDALETLHLLDAAHPVLMQGPEATEVGRKLLDAHEPLELTAIAMGMGATPLAGLALSRALEDGADPAVIGALATRLLGMEIWIDMACREVPAYRSPFTKEAGLPMLGDRYTDDPDGPTRALLTSLRSWSRTVSDGALEDGFRPHDPKHGGLDFIRSGAAAGLRSADRERRIRALEEVAVATITPEGWARREEKAQARRDAAKARSERARARQASSGSSVWPWLVAAAVVLVVWVVVTSA
ncbi:MAG: hypothetical protein KC656_22025 [Myxococcales bacterium]|nr:hypothetical protein [Myxococcales bacterium]